MPILICLRYICAPYYQRFCHLTVSLHNQFSQHATAVNAFTLHSWWENATQGLACPSPHMQTTLKIVLYVVE